MHSSGKQVLFINELEEIMEFLRAEQIEVLKIPLFSCISKLIGSTHFQVAERALFLWNNEMLVNSGCLSKAHCRQSLPLLFGVLSKNGLGHWNNTVETLSANVLKMYMEYDGEFYEQLSNQRHKTEMVLSAKKNELYKKWEALQTLSSKK